MATNKSIQDMIFKSRLTIKYRTEISGTPVEAKLPFRLLVLGDFSGKSAHDGNFHGPLAERGAWSITKGMNLDEILRSTGYSLKVSEPKLQSKFPGRLAWEYPFKMADLRLPSDADGAQSRRLRIRPAFKFESLLTENGVADMSKTTAYATATLKLTTAGGLVTSFDSVTLEVRARVFGESIDVMTQKVAGTVSGRATFDGEIALSPVKGEDSKWSGAIPTGGTVTLSRAPTDPDGFLCSVDGLAVSVERTIPLLRMEDLNPDSVAQSLPELHRLSVIKKLLDELKTEILSRPDLRAALSDALKKDLGSILFRDRETIDTGIGDGARLMNALAALFTNADDLEAKETADVIGKTGVGWLITQIVEVQKKVDAKIQEQLSAVCQDPEFRAVEANWRGLKDLASSVDQDDVIVDFINVTKEELSDDLSENQTDIFGSALFQKVYVEQYDGYGGRPFSAMIGLYDFENTPEDLVWLETMAKIANAAHCPFVSAVSPRFFQPCKTIEEVAKISDLEAMMAHPRFGKWQALRDQPWAAYLGLTLPRYLLRKPWGSDKMLLDQEEPGNAIELKEQVDIYASDQSDQFLWGNAAVLFGKNMIRAYQNSGWAQSIRGPRGGGIVEGLPTFIYHASDYDWEAKKKRQAVGAEAPVADESDERDEILPPVQIAIPDYREYQFSKCGFIPLIHKKGEATATFFGAQSIKKPRDFVEELATKNAYLVTNLAYTFSITRIAHYVKRMMREYIGSTADNVYIQRVLSNWLSEYVTTVANPDDLTLLYYPFKAVSVTVEPKPGPLGFYRATISILPHIQFEGMDVELRLEAALGGAG